MKSRLLVWLGMLACVLVPMAHAVEIMHWERLPLAVPLQVLLVRPCAALLELLLELFPKLTQYILNKTRQCLESFHIPFFAQHINDVGQGKRDKVRRILRAP